MARKRIFALLLICVFLIPTTFKVDGDPNLGIFVPPESMSNNTGYYVFGEGLFMRPTNTHDYAVLHNGDDDENIQGDVASIGYGRDGGFRAGFGLNVPNSPWDISFSGTYIHSDASEFIDDSNFRSLKPTNLQHMVHIDDDDAEFHQALSEVAQITSETEHEMFYLDLMFKHNMRIGSNFNWGVFGGLRYAYIENERKFLYEGQEGTSTDDDGCGFVDDDDGCRRETHSDFWGVGPRLGVQAGWSAPVPGLRVFLNTGLSLLVGEKDVRLRQSINNDDDIDHSVFVADREEDHIAPVLDGQIGISYSAQVTDSLRLSATVGYEVQAWLDMMDRVTPNGLFLILSDDDIQSLPAGLDNDTTNLGLEGFFFRLNGEF